VPQTQVRRYLWAADVFLSLNELSNVGNPLLEAMTAGRCVVTIDEGETRDLVRDGETGVLLSSGEPASIAKSLLELARRPEVRLALGRAAQAFAAANFWSWEQRTDTEVDEVEALVAKARAGHV
jgi:glycosyltransferase involved in cell wall biosynthesis